MEMSHPCNVCAKPASTRCTKCKIAWYCGKACQKAAWPSHKQSCRAHLPAQSFDVHPSRSQETCAECHVGSANISNPSDRICHRVLTHHPNLPDAPLCEQCAHSTVMWLLQNKHIDMMGTSKQLALLVDGKPPCQLPINIFMPQGPEILHRADFCKQLFMALVCSPRNETLVISHMSSHTDACADNGVAPYHLCSSFGWSGFLYEQHRLCMSIGDRADTGYLTQSDRTPLSYLVSVGPFSYNMRYYYVADASGRFNTHRSTWLAQGLTGLQIGWIAVTMYAVLVPIDAEFPEVPDRERFQCTAEYVECPVCFELTNHKIIQCGHAICLECRNKVISNTTRADLMDQTIMCPLCRTSGIISK